MIGAVMQMRIGMDSAAVQSGDVPDAVRERVQQLLVEAQARGQRVPRECGGGSNCFVCRQKNLTTTQCDRCRLRVDPRDGCLNINAFPGRTARCRQTGESFGWLCLPCYSAWLESWQCDLCTGIQCVAWRQCWAERNPMRVPLALPLDVVAPPAPPPPQQAPLPIAPVSMEARLTIVGDTLIALEERMDARLTAVADLITALSGTVATLSSDLETLVGGYEVVEHLNERVQALEDASSAQ